jgi:hypothetical protein
MAPAKLQAEVHHTTEYYCPTKHARSFPNAAVLDLPQASWTRGSLSRIAVERWQTQHDWLKKLRSPRHRCACIMLPRPSAPRVNLHSSAGHVGARQQIDATGDRLECPNQLSITCVQIRFVKFQVLLKAVKCLRKRLGKALMYVCFNQGKQQYGSTMVSELMA